MALGVLRASQTDVDNPPPDVWLIWHAYMLNPTYEKAYLSKAIQSYCDLRWYAEDLERVRILADLKNLPVTPLDLMVVLKIVRISARLT